MCREEGVLAQHNGSKWCQGVPGPVSVPQHQRCVCDHSTATLPSAPGSSGIAGIALLLTVKCGFSGNGGTCHKTCSETGFHKIQLINPQQSQFQQTTGTGKISCLAFCYFSFVCKCLPAPIQSRNAEDLESCQIVYFQFFFNFLWRVWAMFFTVHMPAFISRLLIHFCSCNPEPGFLLLKSLLDR